jgi:Holliday junction DNA helicase RuvA
MFEMLISVSGIGPKGAINILSSVSIEALINAIRTGSHSHLTKVSGIGRKTAEKIVLELKDKVDNIVDSNNTTNLSSDSDAIEALKMLGYNAEESRNALKKINRDIIDTGEKVKAALKVLN